MQALYAKSLRECLLSEVNMDLGSLKTILEAFEPRELSQGEFLLKSGKICREMAFIDSGFLRMYDLVDGKEITLWIGSSGKFITSLSSFVFESENHWSIQALTKCRLYVITRDRHFKLCESEVKWLEFDNRLLAQSFALLEQRMFAHLHTTAKDRFQSLLAREPQLFNHVPLQYIASMLGITPESLSRLRRDLIP